LGTSKTDGQRTTDFLGWNGTSLSSRAETPWNHRPPNAAATGYASGSEFRNLGWLRLTKCDVAKLGPRLALQNRIPETPAFPDHRTCRVFRPAKAESRPAAAWSSPAFSGSHGHNHDHSADQAGAMGRRWPAQEAAPRRLPSRLVLVAGLRLQHDRPLRSRDTRKFRSGFHTQTTSTTGTASFLFNLSPLQSTETPFTPNSFGISWGLSPIQAQDPERKHATTRFNPRYDATTTTGPARHPQHPIPPVAAQNHHCASGCCRLRLLDTPLGTETCDTIFSANGGAHDAPPLRFAKPLTSTCFNPFAAG
jgi:hypothetical protein